MPPLPTAGARGPGWSSRARTRSPPPAARLPAAWRPRPPHPPARADHGPPRAGDRAQRVQDLRDTVDPRLQLHDRREDLLVEDVVADPPRGGIAHERGDRVRLLEMRPGGGEGARHATDVPEARADSRPAELDGEPRL